MTTLLPAPALLTYLIEQMLLLYSEKVFFAPSQSTYDEFGDSSACMMRGRALWLIHTGWKFNDL